MNKLEKITEELSNATGENNPDVVSTENAIASMTKRKTDLEEEKARLITSLTADHQAVDDRQKYYDTCKPHSGGGAKKKWICSGDYHDDGWHSSEGESLAKGQAGIRLYETRLAEVNAAITKIDKDLLTAQDKLVTLRESASRAAMTPVERTQYDSQQKIALGQAEATIKSAEIKAKSTSNNNMILAIAGGLAIITGVVLYFVFRPKKVV